MSTKDYPLKRKATSGKFEVIGTMLLIGGFALVFLGLPIYGFGASYGMYLYKTGGMVLSTLGFVLVSIGIVVSIDSKSQA